MSITCILKGGLGNILFQIATTYQLAKENNDSCYFDLKLHDNSPKPQRGALVYKPHILKNIEDRAINITNNKYYYDSLIYKKIPYSADLILDGYFQSELYFKQYRNEIINLFELSDEHNRYIDAKYKDLEERTSIHIRHGDYVKLQNIHPCCDLNYYKNAIDEIGNNKYIIFSDDINWCKQNFSFLNDVVYVENEQDYLEIHFMAKCKNHIIANSSFSWWGAWLNKKDTKVVCPSKWFGHDFNDNWNDIYCKGWIKI